MKTKLIVVLVGVLVIFTSSTLTKNLNRVSEKGMIKVTILYPNGEGGTFDMDYYTQKHMPMVADVLGKSMKYYKIDKGISGRTPKEIMPYMAIGYLYFNKLSDYQEAFGPNAKKITGDIPNYTNVAPIIQISEVIE